MPRSYPTRPAQASVVAAPILADPDTARAISDVSDAVREVQRNPIVPRSGVPGEVFYRNADGLLQAVAPGESGDVLAIVDSIPVWRSPLIHGDRTVAISAAAMAVLSGSWSYGIFMSTGTMISAGAAIAIWSPALSAGDRCKSAFAALVGDGAVDATVFVLRRGADGSAVSSQTLSVSNVPGAYATYTLDLTDFTLGVGESVAIAITANAANLGVASVGLVYDHP